MYPYPTTRPVFYSDMEIRELPISYSGKFIELGYFIGDYLSKSINTFFTNYFKIMLIPQLYH